MATALKIWTARVYLALMFYIFFLARRRNRPNLHLHPHYINLIPFKAKINFLKTYVHHTKIEKFNFFVEIFGNIVLFIPFVFIIRLLTRTTKPDTIILISVLTSLAVEMIQFILNIGFADIDDLILNLIGASLGVWLLSKRDKSILNHSGAGDRKMN